VGTVPLTTQQRQGLHGEGFVFALASAAGLLVSKAVPDVEGVDWLIGHPGRCGDVRSPKIEVQVKTWSSPRGDDESLRYRMRVQHFNALAGSGFRIPRYLVLVTVPADTEGYAECDARCMRLGHAAYWVSLADCDPIAGDMATTLVTVPRRNLLTAASLVELVTGGHK
jgi:hypothetical protein